MSFYGAARVKPGLLFSAIQERSGSSRRTASALSVPSGYRPLAVRPHTTDRQRRSNLSSSAGPIYLPAVRAPRKFRAGGFLDVRPFGSQQPSIREHSYFGVLTRCFMRLATP